MHSTGGFTFVEALIAVAVSTMILLFAYRIFFSQTEVVTKSLEFIHVNEGFRKVVTFMGDDIREATTILKPVPIFSSNIASQTTKPGVILQVQSSALDPQIPFNSPLGGQISVKRQIVYELEKIEGPESQTIPRYHLSEPPVSKKSQARRILSARFLSTTSEKWSCSEPPENLSNLQTSARQKIACCCRSL